MAYQAQATDGGRVLVGVTRPLPRARMDIQHQVYLELLASAVLDPVGIGGMGYGTKGDSEWSTSTFQARKPASDEEIARSGWTPKQ